MQNTVPIYVTKEEFDSIISQLKTAIESKDNLIMQLNQQIATMQQPLETNKEQNIVATPVKPKETINF